jgi:hypothetical protein
MEAWSILLRAVLCIALALNGSVSAMTNRGHGESKNSSVISAAAKPDTEKSDHAASKQQGCHHVTADASPVDTALPGHAPCPDNGSGDCCKHGTCGGSCAQHCAASILPPSIPRAASLPSTDSAKELAIGHLAPPLPHLIRPPII